MIIKKKKVYNGWTNVSVFANCSCKIKKIGSYAKIDKKI